MTNDAFSSPYQPDDERPTQWAAPQQPAQPSPWASPPQQPFAQQPAAQPSPWATPVQQPAQPTPWEAAQPAQAAWTAPQAWVPGYAVVQRPAPKSPVLGIIGCVGVVVLGIVFAATYHSFGYNFPYFSASSSDAVMRAATPYLLGIVISAFLGFGCLIVSIVATATNRGRPWGIVGIVLGVIAPFVGVVVGGLGVISAHI